MDSVIISVSELWILCFDVFSVCICLVEWWLIILVIVVSVLFIVCIGVFSGFIDLLVVVVLGNLFCVMWLVIVL